MNMLDKYWSIKKNIKIFNFYIIYQNIIKMSQLKKGFFVSFMSLLYVAKLRTDNGPKSLFLMPTLFEYLIMFIKIRKLSKLEILR